MAEHPPAAEPAAPSMSPLRAFAEEATRFFDTLTALSARDLALNGALTLVVVFAAFAVSWLVRRGLTWMRDRLTRLDHLAPPQPRKPVGGVAVALINIGIAIGALLLILEVWGINPLRFAQTATGEALGLVIRIALIVTIAVGAIEVVRFLIGKLLRGAAARSGDLRRAAQLRTLLPLLTGVAQALIVALCAMTLLSEIGVNIGPLLAGAGVVGIAIGFGAQTLVKDLFTGAFLIIEDIVSIGDVIEINGFGGAVEDMTLRTIRLRDFDGTLHIFPYGEAQVIHNRSRSYGYAVFELTITYTSDVETALDLMRQTGETLKADPAFKPDILDDIEVVGVDALSEMGVTLKGRMKTQPGKQWAIGREYQRRIKHAFDKADVQMPRPLRVLTPGAQPSS